MGAPRGRGRLHGTAPSRRSRDVRLLAAIEACYACQEIDGWPQVALRALRELIECDLAGFNDIDPLGGRFLNLLEPHREMPEGWEESWARFGLQNAAFRRLMTAGDVGPYRLSDFMRQRELRSTDLYRTIYRSLGVHYQLAAALEGPTPQVTAFALTRERRDFSNADLELLRLIRPHLRRSYDIARRLSGLERDGAGLAAASKAAGVRVLDLSQAGKIVEATEPALALLARHLAPVGAGDPLPQPLLGWVGRMLARGRPAASRLPTAAGVLSVELVPGAGTPLLLLEEPADADAALLTRRERDILEAMRDGATNAAVGTTLGISGRTVEKHLEHVYRKLGVANRLAAVSTYERLLRGSS